jgi:hypothetical protein
MPDQPEMRTYYVFDLDQHEVDPNFIEFLKHINIKLLFNIDGRRGALATAGGHPTGNLGDLPHLILADDEMLPDLEPLIRQGRQIAATKQWEPLHSGSDNYGRDRPSPPKCGNPKCLEAHQERVKRWEAGLI